MNPPDLRIRPTARQTARRCLPLLLLLLLPGCRSVPRRDADWQHQGPFTRQTLPLEARPSPQPSAYLSRAIAPTASHQLQLLETGDDALLARIQLFRAARENIDIMTYIWRQDGVTRILWDELVAAADRGVQVRLLVDAFPPMGSPDLLAHKATLHENVEIRLFNPPFAEASERNLRQLSALILRFRRMNQRMHHKLTLVDGEVVIVGGRNIEDKYFDRREDFVYKDREVIAIGPVVREIGETFDRFWAHRRSVPLTLFRDVRQAARRASDFPHPLATDEDWALIADLEEALALEDLSEWHPRLQFHDVEGEVTFLTDSPLRFTRRRYRAKHTEIRHFIREAEAELFFQSPYLIYDRQFRRDLVRVRRQHPDVRVIYSTNSLAAADHPFVYAISFKHRKLMFRRMRLDMYQLMPFPAHREDIVPRIARIPGFNPRVGLHAKTLVVDRQAVLIGTHNFDPRSANINSECGLLIRDPAFVAAVMRQLDADIAPENSWVVGRRLNRAPLWRRVSDALGHAFMILPVPDIWPHAYTSVFELIEGKEPVPPRHPEFHERFRDVGLFPGLDDRAIERQVRMIRALGGWTRPLL